MTVGREDSGLRGQVGRWRVECGGTVETKFGYWVPTAGILTCFFLYAPSVFKKLLNHFL